MEKSNLTNIAPTNKKVFIRKNVEESRLGEEIYADDILSPYSVYLMRRFDEASDYTDQAQIQGILAQIPEQFQTNFQDFVIKNIYIRVTSKSVYITLLLALAQPLNKLQMNELRGWIGNLQVPSPIEKIEHTSSVENGSVEVIKSLKETAGEVLLLSETMSDFSDSLEVIQEEINQLKEKRTPPVVKVVKSEAAAKQSLENENAKALNQTIEKMDNFSKRLDELQQKLEDVEKNVSKPRKTPPKFKIELGEGVNKASLEERLTLALQQIEDLTKKVDYSDQLIAAMNVNFETERQKVESTRKEKNQNQSELEQKLTATTKEVNTLTEQLKEVSQKLGTVEKHSLEIKPTTEVLSLMKDEVKKEENKETKKMQKTIDSLKTKLDNMEAQVSKKEEKKTPPVMKLAKSETLTYLVAQHEKDQEHIKLNELEIKKLLRTVGNVDAKLTEANRKIAELENKTKFSTPEVRRQDFAKTITQTPQYVGPKPRNVQEEEETKAPVSSRQASRGFPSKQDFLRASRPAYLTPAPVRPETNSPVEAEEERPTVTLAIEEMLDRVSDRPKGTQNNTEASNLPVQAGKNIDQATLQKLKEMEWDIHSAFRKNRGAGHKGMVPRKEFYSNIRKIEVLPYLWAKVHDQEGKDIIIGSEFSTNQLILDLETLLDEVRALSQKRKVMGKWVYCPKEIEQKIEGYKLLGDYLEMYLTFQGKSILHS